MPDDPTLPALSEQTLSARQKPKGKRKKIYIVTLLVLAGKILIVLALVCALTVWGRGPLNQDKIILVERGMGVRSIAEKLYQERVIYSRTLFAMGVLTAGHRSQLKAGEYAFTTGQTMASVIAELVRGQIYIRQLSFPEGLTVKQIAKLLNAAPSLLGEISVLPQEGSLLPETYYYSWGDKREDILRRMQKSAEATLNELWAKRDPSIMLTTPQEAVILASIVERETAVPTERARIAGVFYNRLKQGMKLQSDPTVIYGLTNGEGVMSRPLWRSDWKHSSPYNTYQVYGLPPGPIANPGRAALEAVMHPETNNFIYFVADGSGGHAFSETLDEHNRNIALRRANQKK